MKQKLLLALLALFTLGGSNLFAQTDVTATYITNPSFESDGLMSAGNGTDPNMIQPTGWTQKQNAAGSYQDNKICNAETSNASNYGTLVTPSDGNYYLFYRHGWNGNNYAEFTSSAANLPAGAYTLKVDYKMVSGSDNTNNNNNTAITLSAISGETTLGTTTAKDAVQVNSNGNTAVLTDNNWITLETTFTLETETSTQFVINLLACGPKRSDFVVDNVRLLQTEFIDPTEISIPSSLSMIETAKRTLEVSLTPEDANHNTDITWTTSDATVATVADGVVTAVGAGTATITATTANGVSATCTVTVTNVTPVAAPSFYSEIAAGDFYIVNAATGEYLGGANAWGTQASLIDHGIPFTVAVGDGVYTLDSHTYNKDTEHFFTGTYVDGASTNLYITSLGDGKYSISTADGSAFVTANVNNTTVANTASTANSVLAQWYFVSKDNRDALLASATDASPADATYYLTEANISRNLRKAYNTSAWTGTFSYGGANENQCAERYCANTDVYQTVTAPNGKYTVSCQGFYRRQSGEATSYLYANDEQVALNQIEFGGVNSMAGASEAFTNGEYTNTLTVYVTDGTLKVGIKCDAATNWTIWDNFEIYYHGPSIGGEAVELADPMEAGKWYYFDLGVDGTYNLTATTLSDIVYTNDGTVLIENEGTVTTKFAGAENQALTAGRYYVKSSSEQTFTFAPASYDYNLGEAVLSTADGGYTQSSTFTVTFPNAVTNDPAGVLALVENSKATVNGAEVALTDAENGFTFELGTITAGATYAIVIPAEVFGYANESMNEQISLTINAPAVLDGIYFLRTTDGKYASRGGNYNTRAMVDEFGLPMHLKTNSNGTSEFILVDSYFHLFDAGNGTVYTDNNTNPYWKIQATEGGYTIINVNNNGSKDKFLGIEDNHLQSIDASYVWSIEPASEHTAKVEPLKDAQAATAAEAAGITASTKEELANILTSSYKAIPVTITGVSSIQEEYQVGASNDFAGAGHTVFTETVEGLTPGLYKLTVKGFHRMTWYADVESASGARSNVYVFAGNAKTQIYSPFDYPATSAWASGNDYQDANGNYYPNNPTGANAAFDADNYVNEVYVYVDGTSLTFGIFNPNRLGNDGNRGAWISYRDFTLTRYVEAADITIKAGRQYTAFSYDKPLDFTGTNLTAQIVTSATGTTQNVTRVPANTGIIVGLTDATTDAVTITVPVCVGETEDVSNNMLVAVLEETNVAQTADGYTNYVFGSKSGGKEQFFKVRADGMTVPANNAYLAIPEAQAKGIDVIGLNGDATGISTIENADMQNGEVYNLQGQKVNRAQKGVYIVNGKKIVKK